MDMSKGQQIFSQEKTTSHAFNNVEVSWNVRGAACTSFQNNVAELIRGNRLDLLFICEPRISGKKALDMIKSLGFSSYEIVDPVGFSGGLWLLWNDTKSMLNRVELSGRNYGIISSLWLVVINYHGCLLGTLMRCCILKDFKRWFTENEMIDLGYSGPRFTWTNNRVFKRLDRAVCNLKWRQMFAEAHVVHLPRTKSDHCPIKICLQSRLSSTPNDRPFRFEAMWMQHESFKDFIGQRWGQISGSAMDKSYGLIESLKLWNRSVFGHLKQRKARILARLAGIQIALCQGPNRFLSQLECFLVQDFNSLLDQEALFWKQKSRLKWLQEGDRNTNFFHMTTLIRRRRNKVERLKDDNGVWVETADSLKALAINFFTKLFSQGQVDSNSVIIPNLFPCMDPVIVSNLLRPIEMSEIKTSLFNIGHLKAPGIDGFPSSFYQNQWSLCAKDIGDLVCKVFQEGILLERLNETLITLVPKLDSPQTMAQFRPISLCCTLYKVISKIIVARLRPFMGRWISPHQVSFVTGRQIIDNIVIVQELMHKFQASKGRKGFFAWKIDLSKAYDRLNWQFVEQVLYELALPPQFIKLSMACVSTVKYKVCINGELTEAFYPGSGIR
ncbi:uncharacterized protein LOC110755503 [Prunus avium]|uniref:Uncharacterized protein LOC110755503 n=1 Tax=Prunus avium TaxID=42229 RepID=A0A6P5S989_PRUAV|nr:uncharacterized protein LOC110755503 [Prunus avium]